MNQFSKPNQSLNFIPEPGEKSIFVSSHQAPPLPESVPLPKPKFKFNNAAERWINTQSISITSKQRKVLLWIAWELKGKKQTIVCFYGRISGDLGITQKAVRSAISSLIKKKVLLDLGIAYNPRNPRQAIGKRFVIPQEIYTIIEFQLQDFRM